VRGKCNKDSPGRDERGMLTEDEAARGKGGGHRGNSAGVRKGDGEAVEGRRKKRANSSPTNII